MTTMPAARGASRDGARARRPALVLAIAAAVLGSALAASATLRERADEPRGTRTSPGKPLTVDVRPLRVTDRFQRTRSFVGQVEPARRAEVGFELAGLLNSINVDEGDRVEAGDLLATLDTARLEARRRELHAEVNLARARLDLARSTRTRIGDLSDRGHASMQRLDEADEAFLAARASLDLSRARLDSLATEMDKSVLHAPFDARVTRRHLDEGRVMDAGVPVLTLQEERDPQARIGLVPKAADRVDTTRSYTLDIGGRRYLARPRSVLPVTTSRTRTVDVLFDIDAPAGALRAGALAELALPETVTATGAWVPLDALTAGARGTWVLYGVHGAASEGGAHAFHARVRTMTVELLAQDGERAYVRGAFASGDGMIAGGLNRVVPGQRVRFETHRRVAP